MSLQFSKCLYTGLKGMWAYFRKSIDILFQLLDHIAAISRVLQAH